MRITPANLITDFSKSDLVRSPGQHASDIYGSLYKYLEPKRYDLDGPPNDVLMALGTAWEHRVEYLLRANGIDATRPDELMSPEGIAYSPDLLIDDPDIDEIRLGEIKLTSMSLDDIPGEHISALPEKMSKYATQMLLYAYWLGTHYGWLGICSIRQPYAPVFRGFNIEWTDRELQSNYALCMNHRATMAKQAKGANGEGKQ